MDYNTAPAAFITNVKPAKKNSGHGERSGFWGGGYVEKLAMRMRDKRWVGGMGEASESHAGTGIHPV